MGEDSGEPVYYVISDLHIGGDEQLEHVEFLDELLGLLGRLETTDENAELIVNGDAFGLWEFTAIDGPAKFDLLVDRYPELFEQLWISPFEDVELLHPLDCGELPEAERVAVDHQFNVLVGLLQSFKEGEQFVEELDLLQLFVAPDMEIADHVINPVGGTVDHGVVSATIS